MNQRNFRSFPPHWSSYHLAAYSDRLGHIPAPALPPSDATMNTTVGPVSYEATGVPRAAVGAGVVIVSLGIAGFLWYAGKAEYEQAKSRRRRGRR